MQLQHPLIFSGKSRTGKARTLCDRCNLQKQGQQTQLCGCHTQGQGSTTPGASSGSWRMSQATQHLSSSHIGSGVAKQRQQALPHRTTPPHLIIHLCECMRGFALEESLIAAVVQLATIVARPKSYYDTPVVQTSDSQCLGTACTNRSETNPAFSFSVDLAFLWFLLK